MKNFTRILIVTSLVVTVIFNAQSQDVFKTANVGIGTIAPQQKLDVAGNVKFSGALMPGTPVGLPGSTGNILLSQGAGVAPIWLANGAAGTVLQSNGTAAPTWGTLSLTAGWALTGNSIAATNFLGTTDAEPLVFKVNNVQAGRIDLNFGVGSSLANTYLGTGSTAYGSPGGSTGDGGTLNVGIGISALGSVLATPVTGGNTAVGAFAYPAAPGGDWNTSVGAYSQYNASFINANQGYNVAIGAYSMYSNYTGASAAVIGSYNTAIGYQSMYGSAVGTYGNYNTALGYNSLYNIAAGGSNTALGSNALYNTTAGRNVGVGDSSLYSNTTGEYNTGLGYQSNVGAPNLTNATAIGYQASAPASNSIALGNPSVAYNGSTGAGLYLPGYTSTGALFYTATNTGQVATLAPGTAGYILESQGTSLAPQWVSVAGVNAVTGTPPIYITNPGPTPDVNIQGSTSGTDIGGVLYSTGSGNSAVFNTTGTSGYVLESGGTSAPTWANPTSAAAWNLTGNTVTTSNFLGTTNNMGIMFRVDGTYAGSIDAPLGGNPSASEYDVYLGYGASGVENTASSPNNTGDEGGGGATFSNVGVGFEVLGNMASTTTVRATVAIGPYAMYDISGVSGSTAATTSNINDDAIGAYTLYNNTANDNVGVGSYALFSNTAGISETALGYQSMYGSGTAGVMGSSNTAAGYQSLYSITAGGFNTAVGSQALYSNTASKNTALGDSALASNTSGAENTAAGYQAMATTASGNGNVSGTFNTALGAFANMGVNNLTNATAIGAYALATTSNQVVLGSNGSVAGSTAVTEVGFNGALAPFYGAAYNTGAAGNLLISEGAGVAPQWLANGTSGYVLSSTGTATAPTWVAAPTGTVTSITAGNGLTATPTNPITSSGTIALNNGTATGQVFVTGASPYTPALETMSQDAVIAANGAVTVQGLQTYPVSATGPTPGNILAYSTQWQPTTGGSAGQVLTSAGTGVPTWTTLTVPNAWLITGNTISGTYGNDFIGTATSGQPLEFEANSIYMGQLDASKGNVFFGQGTGGDSLAFIASGGSNVALGYESLVAQNSSTSGNSAIGAEALHFNTASNNNAVGYGALHNNTTGTPNDAYGYEAGFSNTTGTFNVDLGFEAGYYNKTGTLNVTVGDSAMYGGYPATGVGALYTVSTGNTAVGVSALAEIASTSATTGAYNTAVGYEAGLHTTTGTYNSSLGYRANYSNQTAFGNVAVGSNALYANTWSGNTAVGTGAMQNTNAGGPYPSVSNPTSPYVGGANVAVGDSAMYANVGGVQNVVVGWAALTKATGVLTSNDTSVGNVAIGFESMLSQTNGSYNTAVGDFTMNSDANASYCVVLGFGALRYATTTGTSIAGDIAIGNTVFNSASFTGNYDIAMGGGNGAGAGAMYSATSGSYDIALGFGAASNGTALTTGNYDVAIGYESIVGSTQNNNTAIGYSSSASGGNSASLGYLASAAGSNATAIGEGTSASNTNNTALGAGAQATGTSNATAIGANATAPTANTIILGQTATATSVGIGTTAPARLLEVAGTTNTIRVDGLGAGNTFGNTAPSLSSDQIMYAKGNSGVVGDVYSMPNGTSGYVLTINGSGVPAWAASSSLTASSPLTITSGNILLSGTSGGVLYGLGAGTGSAFTSAGPVGEVLEGQGPGNEPVWTTIALLAGTGDNWGSQVAVTDSDDGTGGFPNQNLNESTISGNGVAPLKLAQDGATPGEVLVWTAGSGYGTWKPGSANASLSTATIQNGGVNSVVVVTNGTSQVVNSALGNVAIDVQGASGEVLYGTGTATSAAFTTGGTTGEVLELNSGVPTWTNLGTASGWFLTGNSGTTPGTNFLGTTDNQPFYFDVYAINAGAISEQSPASGGAANVYLGAASTTPNLAGAGNTDGGGYNVGIGLSALASTVSSTYNYANIAVGAYALAASQGGTGNVAIGYEAQRLFNPGITSTNGSNTALGYEALYSNSTGLYNTALGYESMYGSGSATADGNYNTAEGYNALYTAGAGASNTAIGSNALLNNTNSRNTAVGDSALYSNTSGFNNTAIGYQANVTGNPNNATVIGFGATQSASNSVTLGNSLVSSLYLPGYTNIGDILYTSTGTGLVSALTPGGAGTVLESQGTGAPPAWINVVGVSSVTGTPPIYSSGGTTPVVSIMGSSTGTDAGGILYSTGSGNSAVFTSTGTSGDLLQSNGTNSPSWVAIPTVPNTWLLTGNSGTTPGTNFLGTTGATGLEFKVNNAPAGIIDINASSSGNANTYLGSWGTLGATNYGSAGNINAGTGADPGAVNVAVGLSALGSTGNSSGVSNNNIAVGAFSLANATGGIADVAIGTYSQLLATTTTTSQGYNTSIGAYSLYSNTIGSYNTAVGYQSMYGNGTGSQYGAYNTAEGYNSLYKITSGGSNTAVGSNSLYNTTSGKNTAVGDSALASNTSGTYNTALGYDADVSSGTLSNATAIGAYAYAAQSNSMVLGSISGINNASANTNVGIGTNTPDADAALAVKTLHLETQPLSSGNTSGAAYVGSGVTFGGLTGTDVAGVVNFTIPASAITGGQVTISFAVANPYTTAPTVIVTPANGLTGGIVSSGQPYVTSTTTSFTINFGAAPGNGSTEALSFNYFVIESQ